MSRAAEPTSDRAAPRQISGAALASLACGLAGFAIPVVPGLLAIWLGVLGLRQARKPNFRGRRLAVAGIVAGALSIVVAVAAAVVVWPRVQLARELSRRSECAKHMTEIGAALLAYAHNNRGEFPPSLDVIVEDNSLPAELLVCPDDRNASVARGSSGTDQAESLRGSAMTRAARASQLATTLPATTPADVPGPHLSYTYLGRGLTPEVPDAARIVVLYEPPALHGGGMNVLFADGHVQFVPAPEAARVAALLEQGINPPAPAEGH